MTYFDSLKQKEIKADHILLTNEMLLMCVWYLLNHLDCLSIH